MEEMEKTRGKKDELGGVEESNRKIKEVEMGKESLINF